ncbi:UDP-N-acetylglucosamine 1-carboxyvinyltransferase [Sphaerochaeta sp. PS]|uniref:UDP-N-acetylglucosamine 1-carboxyvinyltransferase n=1 Tax=Sphaerochaeta sp. PS TaxID=3076336 RepID=UPI0028A48CB3|nr:UDP-N-acetylglucosamine 1-carboxyvinyltransferase [Sphaerochaeta sp. PS]MDT4762468.1 UDP-N-acetylglucosamine 1-carboxyvinyltransferase [Sphaerochaeta sp. PS]
MASYRIEGGIPASGEVSISGNKNAALPCLAATLLTDDLVRLCNVPDIEDVRVMCKLLENLGSTITKVDAHTLEISSGSRTGLLGKDSVEAVRGSILLLGPLLAIKQEVSLDPPGGDVIGLRRLDTHFLGLSSLGASCLLEPDGKLHLKAKHSRLKGGSIFLDEASVTATENVIMAASLAEGESILSNAACEPHVQDLCTMLTKMGCRIEGIGSNRLFIKGEKKLHGCEFTLGSDYMEVGSFIGLAGATGGQILIKKVELEHLRMIRLGFERIGVEFIQDGPSSILVPRKQKRVLYKEVGGHTGKVDDAPWPGFPADLLSIITVCATQMEGSILVHEKMYESRMYFVDWLIRMGADIILCDPHRAVVNGPSQLYGSVVTSPDVRAGMALVIAALCAEGTSTIENIYQIERGYERLSEKLFSLGLAIERIS